MGAAASRARVVAFLHRYRTTASSAFFRRLTKPPQFFFSVRSNGLSVGGKPRFVGLVYLFCKSAHRKYLPTICVLQVVASPYLYRLPSPRAPSGGSCYPPVTKPCLAPPPAAFAVVVPPPENVSQHPVAVIHQHAARKDFIPST